MWVTDLKSEDPITYESEAEAHVAASIWRSPAAEPRQLPNDRWAVWVEFGELA